MVWTTLGCVVRGQASYGSLSAHPTGTDTHRMRARPTRESNPLAGPLVLGVRRALVSLMLLAGGSCALAQVRGSDQTPQSGQPAGEPASQDASSARGPLVNRPKTAGRIVSLFDFEERETNPGELPQHWSRDQDQPGTERRRSGFPHWNHAVLLYSGDGAIVHRGEGAARLPTTGGSTSMTLSSGVIPIYPDDDYLISAWIRTEGLEHARAIVVGRFLDGSGKVIADSEVTTTPTISQGAWTEVSVELRGRWSEAAWVQLELQVLQPRQRATPEQLADKNHIFSQDLSGSAWFDDVAVVQLPRVELRSLSPAGITRAPDRPVLSLLIRDLSGEDLDLSLEVRDHRGVVVDERRERVTSGRLDRQWVPTLPRLGWYRASMSLTSQIGRVGVTTCDFLWLGAVSPGWNAGTSGDAIRFGVEAREWNDVAARDLPAIVRGVGVGSVTLPAWDAASTPETILKDAEARAITIAAIQSAGADVTLTLPVVPTSLNATLTAGRDDLWTVMAGDEKVWLPYAQPVFETLGATVSRWRVDSIDRVPTGAQARLVGLALERHLPSPLLLGAADLWDSAPSLLGATPMQRVISVPETMTPAAVSLAAAGWSGLLTSEGARETASTVLLRRPTGSDDRAEQIAEMAKRVVEVWRASRDGGASIVLEEPWTMPEAARPALNPRPELAAFHAIMEHLADRRIVGQLPVAPGVICYLLAPRPGAPATRGGALVAWNESAAPQAAILETYVGIPESVRVFDLMGNARAPRTTPGHSGGRTLLREPLTSQPIFVEGVDVALLRVLSSIRFEPARLEATTQTQELTLVVDNPSPSALSGTITLLEPGGFEREGTQRDRSWRISPRTLTINTPPGGTARVPITIAFSPLAEVGDREFVLRCLLDSGSSAREPIIVRRPVTIGLSNVVVDLRTFSRVSASGATDLVLEASVTNTGTGPLTLDLTAFAPDRPRMKGLIKDLPAGSQAIRQFVFPAAAAELAGTRLSLAVEDREASARVNRSIEVR